MQRQLEVNYDELFKSIVLGKYGYGYDGNKVHDNSRKNGAANHQMIGQFSENVKFKMGKSNEYDSSKPNRCLKYNYFL